MLEAPGLFANPPEAVDVAGRVLSDVLRSLRIASSVYLNATFSAPFGVISSRRFDAGSPLASLRHISVFHLCIEGGCTLELASGERREIFAGDVVLMPFADEHRLSAGRPDRFVRAGEVIHESTRVAGMGRLVYGGGGARTRFVCGFLESSEFLFAPVFRSLPELLIARAEPDGLGAVLAATVGQIATLSEQEIPGSDLILGRLMEALFTEVLRRHAVGLPQQARGWFAALREPRLVRAIQQIHADPSRRWTVEELARTAGSSRSVLAMLFNDILGQSPMEYVAHWRMQLAVERLRQTADSLGEIAAGIGYDSEAAFNRAFKRVTGATPGKWRQDAQAACA